MNFLQLVQRSLLLLRAGNEKLSDPPTTLDDLTGINFEVKQWVAMAVEDIQNLKPDWLFMRKQANIVVPQGQRVVNIAAALTDLQELIPSSGDDDGRFITSYSTDQQAEIKCWYVPYEIWRGSVYDRQPREQSSAPIRFTIQPDGQLVLDPTPSQAINLVFDYKRKAIPVIGADDVPAIPVEAHMAIVHWVIVEYYCLTRDKSSEFRQKAAVALNREKTKLFNQYLPEVTYGGTNP